MADEKVTEVPASSKKSASESIPAEWIKEAESGDEGKQLQLGKHYLSLADSDVDREENASKAIFWLVQASKQGNDEATKDLKKCLQTGTGVSDENKEDVKWCITTSSVEKKIRYAARSLFKTIDSTHKQILSKDEYVDAVKGLTGGAEQKLLLAAGKRIGDNISETEFVKLLSKKVQGEVTLTSDESAMRSDAYETAGPLEKVLKYPRETASVVADQALEFASKDGLNLVMSCIPTDQIYFLFLFFLYGFVTPKILLLVVPLVIFYISYAVIIVATLQMFYTQKKLKEASTLAGMLKSYDVGVDVDQTQSQYTWNSLTPYFVYFGAIPLVVVSFSVADKTYIPCSELGILSAVFCGICFMAISDSHDLVTLLALFFNFLAALPTFFHNFPDIPVISSLIHIFSSSWVSLELFAGIQLNIGISSICYCIIPIFFIQMGARKSWQGMYRVLVPHLVCYFWWNLFVTFYPFTTWFGLARATVGYLLLPLLVPLSLFIFLIGGVYVLVKLSSTEWFGKIIITLMLLGLTVLLTQTKKLFGGKLDKNYGSVKKIVMVGFAVLAIIPLIFVRLPSTAQKTVVPLTLDSYVATCHPGDISNTADMQIKCTQLKGSKVSWNGVVSKMSVTKIENNVEPILAGLPSIIAKPLRCIYGEKFGECDDEAMTDQERDFCVLMTSLGHECHLEAHNTYTFSLGLSVQTEAGEALSLSLDAGNNLKKILTAVESGDEVQFTATLLDGLGTGAPKLKLKQLTCTSRELVFDEEDEEAEEDMYNRVLNQAASVSFNFFWYPLVEYVSE